MMVVLLRPEVQPSQRGVPALLLLPADHELQYPGGGELLQPLPLLRQLQSPRSCQSQHGRTGQAELYHLHAGNRNTANCSGVAMSIFIPGFVRCEIYQTVLHNPNISLVNILKLSRRAAPTPTAWKWRLSARRAARNPQLINNVGRVSSLQSPV